MRFTSQTSSGGVFEQLFLLGEIPGVLWTPEDADGTRPLIAMGHGGGGHKKAPGIVDRARRFVAEGGFAWRRSISTGPYRAPGRDGRGEAQPRDGGHERLPADGQMTARWRT